MKVIPYKALKSVCQEKINFYKKEMFLGISYISFTLV